jgi:4-hydroxybenzoyl-CoA thioesterase
MFVNRIRIRVEFGDCDPANIVFFANHFRWFDQCISALFRAAGLPLGELFKSHGVVGIPFGRGAGAILNSLEIRR